MRSGALERRFEADRRSDRVQLLVGEVVAMAAELPGQGPLGEGPAAGGSCLVDSPRILDEAGVAIGGAASIIAPPRCCAVGCRKRRMLIPDGPFTGHGLTMSSPPVPANSVAGQCVPVREDTGCWRTRAGLLAVHTQHQQPDREPGERCERAGCRRQPVG